MASLLLVSTGCHENSGAGYTAKGNKSRGASRMYPVYYSANNLLVDSLGQVFIHHKDSVANAYDTGTDWNFPDFINLQPEDITLLPESSIVKLVDSLKLLESNDRNSLQVAVDQGQASARRAAEIVKAARRRAFTNIALRKPTEEEAVVLHAKEQHRPYNFYKVSWRSRFSSMSFPPPPTIDR